MIVLVKQPTYENENWIQTSCNPLINDGRILPKTEVLGEHLRRCTYVFGSSDWEIFRNQDSMFRLIPLLVELMASITVAPFIGFTPKIECNINFHDDNV